MDEASGRPSTEEAKPIAYLATTFPKLSETFVQRELKGLLKAGLDIRIHSIWGGDTHFDEYPVAKFSMWELVGIPVWLIYWLFRKPRVVLAFIVYLCTRPKNFLNFQEMWLGAGYGLLKASSFARSNVRKMHTAWATMPATAALFIHRLTEIPFSLGAHAYDIYVDGGDGLLPEKVGSATFVQSSNQTARSELARRFPEYAEKMFCVRRCFEHLPPFKVKIPQTTQRLSLLSVGRLVPKKGYGFLIKLMCAARKRDLDWTLKIIGEGPEKEALLQQIREYALEDRVTLTGAQEYSAVQAAYESADVFVFSGIISDDGDRDGLPNVVPEAMAHGIPVFAEPNPGVKEAVIDGETGWLVSFRSPDAVIGKMLQALSRSTLEPVLINAYNWVEDHFDIEKTTTQLMKLHGSET